MLGLLEDYRLRGPQQRSRGNGSVRSTCWARRSPSSGSRSSPRSCSGRVAGAPGARSRTRAAAPPPPDRRAGARTCSRARTTARRVGSRSRSPNPRSPAGHGFAATLPGTSRGTWACSPNPRRAPWSRWRPSATTELEDAAAEAGVPFARLGETGGPGVVFDGLFETTVAEIAAVYEDAIPSCSRDERHGRIEGPVLASRRVGAEGPKEECGVFGVWAPGDDVARLDLLRALRPAAPGPGGGRDGGLRRRAHPGVQGAGARLPGVRRGDPLDAPRRPRDRAQPLLHDRLRPPGRTPSRPSRPMASARWRWGTTATS